jgi:hypothetical protein
VIVVIPLFKKILLSMVKTSFKTKVCIEENKFRSENSNLAYWKNGILTESSWVVNGKLLPGRFKIVAVMVSTVKPRIVIKKSLSADRQVFRC